MDFGIAFEGIGMAAVVVLVVAGVWIGVRQLKATWKVRPNKYHALTERVAKLEEEKYRQFVDTNDAMDELDEKVNEKVQTLATIVNVQRQEIARLKSDVKALNRTVKRMQKDTSDAEVGMDAAL